MRTERQLTSVISVDDVAAADQLLRRILQEPHRVVSAIAAAADRPAARASLQAEFGISDAEVDMVLDQQFSLLIQERLNKL